VIFVLRYDILYCRCTGGILVGCLGLEGGLLI